MLCGGCSTSCIRCIQLRHASKVYGRAGSYTSTIAAPPWRVRVRVSTARQASTAHPSTTCSPTHQRPRPPRCWAHLPQAGKHLGEEVLSSGVEEVQLDAHIRVGDGHLLRAELGAARHLVRLRELRSRRVEHLHQGRLAHGWVAGLRSQGTRNHEGAHRAVARRWRVHNRSLCTRITRRRAGQWLGMARAQRSLLISGPSAWLRGSVARRGARPTARKFGGPCSFTPLAAALPPALA